MSAVLDLFSIWTRRINRHDILYSIISVCKRRSFWFFWRRVSLLFFFCNRHKYHRFFENNCIIFGNIKVSRRITISGVVQTEHQLQNEKYMNFKYMLKICLQISNVCVEWLHRQVLDSKTLPIFFRYNFRSNNKNCEIYWRRGALCSGFFK